MPSLAIFDLDHDLVELTELVVGEFLFWVVFPEVLQLHLEAL